MKTLKMLFKQDKEEFVVPKGVQDVIPIPMDEAVREVENRRLGVETNITNWQRRQNSNNNFSAIIPYDLE